MLKKLLVIAAFLLFGAAPAPQNIDPSQIKGGVPWISVKAYGAKGDAKTVDDGIVNSTTTVTSATANFTSTDVGKLFYAVQSPRTIICPETTIASVTNSTTAILSAACTGTNTGMAFVWGHNDSVAIHAAQTAVLANAYGGILYFPAGGYICETLGSACLTNTTAAVFGLMGDDQKSSVLYLTPNSTPVNDAGAFITENINADLIIENMGFDGRGLDFANAPSRLAGLYLNGALLSMHNVFVRDYVATFGGIQSPAIKGSAVGGVIDNLYVDLSTYSLILNGVTNIRLTNSLLSNSTFGPNLLISNSGPASAAGVISLSGVIADECASCSQTVLLNNSKDILISNSVIYASIGSVGLEVDGTSSAQLTNSNLTEFAARNNATAEQVDSGGVLKQTNTVAVGTGTGSALNNAGTFSDGGGNSFTGGITNTGTINGPSLIRVSTNSNCSSSASPAVCGSSASGSVVVAAAATTVVVNTTAVTANSQIIVTFDASLGTKLGVTCNATEPALYGVSARSAGTSFTITSTMPTANPACFSYFIVN